MATDDPRDAILEELDRIAPDLEVETLPEESHFFDDLGIDSMDFLNLVSALQKRLDLSIPERDFPKIATIGALTRYVSEKKG